MPDTCVQSSLVVWKHVGSRFLILDEHSPSADSEEDEFKIKCSVRRRNSSTDERVMLVYLGKSECSRICKRCSLSETALDDFGYFVLCSVKASKPRGARRRADIICCTGHPCLCSVLGSCHAYYLIHMHF